MKLTREEEKLILEQRALEEAQKPKKVGILKHDLYYFNERFPEVRFSVEDIVEENCWWFTKDTILSIVENIKDDLLSSLLIEKGTPFVCYIGGGEEEWYDDVGVGIEGYDSEWASKNLIDIKPI